MAPRKTTIFRQLIFNIAIPTLLALLVFAGINFLRTRSILVSGTDEKNRILSNEITKILKKLKTCSLYPSRKKKRNKKKLKTGEKIKTLSC